MGEDALMICRRAKTRIERKRNKFFKAVAEHEGAEIKRTKRLQG